MLETAARTCRNLPSANKAVEKYLKPHFDARCLQCVECILNSDLEFSELGIFGSYARGDYKATSDIDFYAEICKCIDSLDIICIISLKTLKNAKYTDYGLYTVKYSPGTLLVEEL